MTKKRAVFLFGAGATLAWISPTTSELTELVRTTGFKCADNTTRITEFIYTTLLANGYPSRDVNFETIITVVEELINYYSKFDNDLPVASISGVFLASRYEKELLNYSITGGKVMHGYELQIPAGQDYRLSKRAYHGETTSQLIFLNRSPVRITVSIPLNIHYRNPIVRKQAQSSNLLHEE